MGFAARAANVVARTWRGMVSRLGTPRAPTRTVVVRRPDRRTARQLPIGVGSWDRRFEEVQEIIAGHEVGQFRASGILADVLDRNPRIFGALNNRALGVIGAPFSILPGLGDRRRAASIARTLETDWPMMVPEETAAELLRTYVAMGFAVARVRILTVRGRWVPVLEPWHPSFLRWDALSEQLVALTDTGEMPVTPGDGWVLLAGSRTRPWMRGIVRCLGLPAETRNYAVRDWARWSEKHGQPWVELQVPASKAESDEADVWFAQMRDIGTEPVIVSPQGDEGQASFKVNLIEAKDTAWEGFKELIARQDGDVSIAIEGQNLSTENTTVGAKASAAVGHGIRQDLREADAWVLAAALHEQLLAPWSAWNFGDAELAPWAVYDPTPPEDLAQFATLLKSAGDAITAWEPHVKARGLAVDIEELAERFGMPLRSAPSPEPAPTDDAPEERDTVGATVVDLAAVRARQRRAAAFITRKRLAA